MTALDRPVSAWPRFIGFDVLTFVPIDRATFFSCSPSFRRCTSLPANFLNRLAFSTFIYSAFNVFRDLIKFFQLCRCDVEHFHPFIAAIWRLQWLRFQHQHRLPNAMRRTFLCSIRSLTSLPSRRIPRPIEIAFQATGN